MVIVAVISTPYSETFVSIASLRTIEIFVWPKNANKPFTDDLAGKRLACEGNLGRRKERKVSGVPEHRRFGTPHPALSQPSPTDPAMNQES